MTLIEVLVVFTILIVLLGLTVPVFRRAGEKSRASSCSANLSQIGRAMMAYMADYDRKLPPRMIMAPNGSLVADSFVGWIGKTGKSITWLSGPSMGVTNDYSPITIGRRYLNPYLNLGTSKEVWVACCPSDEPMKNFFKETAYDGYGTSYISNTSHDNNHGGTGKKQLTFMPNGYDGLPVAFIRRPARMIAVAELGAFKGSSDVKDEWHDDGRVGMLFVDGHVGRFIESAADYARGYTDEYSWTYDK